MSVLARLSTVFGEAFASLGLDPSHGAVGPSQRPDLAQFQCNGAMAAARDAGRNPRELAAAVIDAVADRSPYRDLSIAGPGFINITLTDEVLAEATDALRGDDRLGHIAGEPNGVLVDYGGPNVAKPMHVGHLRATVIGESLVRLFRFAGHRVWGDAHFGDWGTQMGQVIIGIEDRMPDLPYFDSEFEGPYPDESPVGLDDLQEIYPLVADACRRDAAMAERARAAALAPWHWNCARAGRCDGPPAPGDASRPRAAHASPKLTSSRAGTDMVARIGRAGAPSGPRIGGTGRWYPRGHTPP